MVGPIRITVGGPARDKPVVPAGGVEPEGENAIARGLGQIGELFQQSAERGRRKQLAGAIGGFNTAVQQAENDILTAPRADITSILSKLQSSTETIQAGLSGETRARFDEIMAEQGGAIGKRLEGQKYKTDVGRAFGAAKARMSRLSEAERRALLDADDIDDLDDVRVAGRFQDAWKAELDGIEDPIEREQFQEYVREHGQAMLGNQLDIARTRRDRQLGDRAAARVGEILGGTTADNLDARRAEVRAELEAARFGEGEVERELAEFDGNAAVSIANQEEQAHKNRLIALLLDESKPANERVATAKALIEEKVGVHGAQPFDAENQFREFSERTHANEVAKGLEEDPVGFGRELLTNPDALGKRSVPETTKDRFREQARTAISREFSGRYSDAAIENVASPTVPEIARMTQNPSEIPAIEAEIFDRVLKAETRFNAERADIELGRDGSELAARTQAKFRKEQSALVGRLEGVARGATILGTPGRSDLSAAGQAAVNSAAGPVVDYAMSEFRGGRISLEEIGNLATTHADNARFLPTPWKNAIDGMFASSSIQDKVGAAVLFNRIVAQNPGARAQFDNSALMENVFNDASRPGFNFETYSKETFDRPANVRDAIESWRRVTPKQRKVNYEDTVSGFDDLPAGFQIDWEREVERQIVGGRGLVTATQAMADAAKTINARGGKDAFSPLQVLGEEGDAQITGDMAGVAKSLGIEPERVRAVPVVDPSEEKKELRHGWYFEIQDNNGNWKPYERDGEAVLFQADETEYKSAVEARGVEDVGKARRGETQVRRQVADVLAYRALLDRGFSAEAVAKVFPSDTPFAVEESRAMGLRPPEVVEEIKRDTLRVMHNFFSNQAFQFKAKVPESVDEQVKQLRGYLKLARGG